ncbi:helix-turn-helix domain-containing protein, partial [Streptomyces poriticola]|uniref:helix-turn-helix domain-containing protein n=1 Tax=Streptomyces poriticola TaxID=3120506 RepID=UPI002FCDE3AB
MTEEADAERVTGRDVLGRTLRFLRERSGKSLAQLADETGYDKSYLSRLESGERLSKVTVMEDLDSYHGCGDLLVSHWRIARIDAFKDKYKEFMRLESTARIMHKYGPMCNVRVVRCGSGAPLGFWRALCCEVFW